MEICKTDNCNKPSYCRGYCKNHYYHIWKYGELRKHKKLPNDIIINEDYAEIILRNNKGDETQRAMIDIEDVEMVKKKKWYYNGKYVVSGYNPTIRLHSFIMTPAKNKIVDHINHNTLDNRKQNMRVCFYYENSMNQRKSGNNTSGYRGICFNESMKSWWARIQYKGERIDLGYFATPEEAFKIRRNAELKYFGDYAINE
jgi:hypothetical protein